MAWRERFSQAEWDRLRLLPALLFTLVAGADGRVDKKEWQYFRDELAKGHSHPLLQLIYRELSGLEPQPMMDLASAACADPEHTRLTIKSLQFRLTPQEYTEFTRALFQAGLGVAKASGGFLGMGRVSESERLTLLDFGVMFEVELDSLL